MRSEMKRRADLENDPNNNLSDGIFQTVTPAVIKLGLHKPTHKPMTPCAQAARKIDGHSSESSKPATGWAVASHIPY